MLRFEKLPAVSAEGTNCFGVQCMILLDRLLILNIFVPAKELFNFHVQHPLFFRKMGSYILLVSHNPAHTHKYSFSGKHYNPRFQE
jgi:hypothetical protein